MHDDNDTNKETTGVEERVSLAMSDDIIPVSPFFAIRVALNVPEQKERGAATLSINKRKEKQITNLTRKYFQLIYNNFVFNGAMGQ